MRHLRALLINIGDFLLRCLLWLKERFGEFTTYIGLLITGLCFLQGFMLEDPIKGWPLFFPFFISGLLIFHRQKRRG